MVIDLLIMAVCGAVGALLQRSPESARLRAALWQVNYVAFIPLAGAYAFLTLTMDQSLVALVACGVIAWWVTIVAADVWSRASFSSSRPAHRAVTLMAGAFPNTGFLGYPLTHLAYGDQGLRLAILYDQISLVIPAVVVATIIARRAGRSAGDRPLAHWSMRRELVTSPPLWTVVGCIALRLTLRHEPLHLNALGAVVAHGASAIGFLLLGLSIPLQAEPA